MNTISFGTCSPALEYATNNIGKCKVVITVYANDGSLIGTELINDPALVGFNSVKQRCEKYDVYLDRTRKRMQKYSGRNTDDAIPITAVPPGRYF